MSRRNNQSTRKPYCKVCHDAGKTEAEYTSHFVRKSPDPKSPVVCPTLLSAECRYCYEIGHTPSCCPALKEKKIIEERSAKDSARLARARDHVQKKQQQQQAPASRAAKFGGFAALADSDDDEKPSRVTPILTPREEFPSLVQAKPAPKPVQVGNSWAARVAMEPEPKPAEPNAGMVVISDCFTGAPLKIRESVFTKALGLNPGENVYNSSVVQVTKPLQVSRKSWADWSDSEDEDEDQQQQEATDAW
jgi:hypothetical protein